MYIYIISHNSCSKKYVISSIHLNCVHITTPRMPLSQPFPPLGFKCHSQIPMMPIHADSFYTRIDFDMKLCGCYTRILLTWLSIAYLHIHSYTLSWLEFFPFISFIYERKKKFRVYLMSIAWYLRAQSNYK